jgi:GTPase SAR1 family protein
MIAKSFYLQASCIVITYCEPSLARKTIEDFILEINENAQVKVVIVIVRTKIDQTPLYFLYLSRTPEEKLILEEFV